MNTVVTTMVLALETVGMAMVVNYVMRIVMPMEMTMVMMASSSMRLLHLSRWPSFAPLVVARIDP